jgi:hypothetical protein
MNADLRLPNAGGTNDKLRAKIEASTQAHVLAEAMRINKASANSDSAPTAEVMSEVFETPEEIWLVSRVRTVAQSLYKDYLRMLLPYIDADTRTIAKDAPSDDDLRETLARSSKTYATFAKSNQHATWFKFYTDRTRTNADRETVAEMLELRVAVETGQLTEQEAKIKLSTSRAGVLAKARALENIDKLKDAGIEPTRRQIKETHAAVKAIQADDAAAASAATRRGGAVAKAKGRRAMSPATLLALRERAADLTAMSASTSNTKLS